jgi:hypothetical protein
VSGPKIRLDRSAVEARRVDDELVIYEKRRRRYLGGNATAAALWPSLVEGTSMDDLAQALADSYGIGLEHAAADASRFVEALRAQNLLED